MSEEVRREGHSALRAVPGGGFETFDPHPGASSFSATKLDTMKSALLDCAEALEVALGRLGVCGHGDGKDHGADVDSFGGMRALAKARDALRGEDS